MTTYADGIEEVRISRDMPQVKRHAPVVMPRDYPNKVLTCTIFSMEEGIIRHVLEIKNDKGRKHSRSRAYLDVCSDQNCDIICHICCQEDSRMREITKFAGLICFEIYHHENCKDLFVNIHRENITYSRSLQNYSVRTLIIEIYKDYLPRRSERTIRGRPTNVAQSCPNRTTEVDEATDDTDLEESKLPNPKRVRK